MQPFADKIAYIQARASDNPHLSQSYVDALNTLPEKLRKAIPRRRLEYIRKVKYLQNSAQISM